jgi:hypothetical protein
MPVHQEYTREILATKLEQLIWHLDQVERVHNPRDIIEAPRPRPRQSRRGSAWLELDSGAGSLNAANLPKPLVPASLIVQLVTSCTVTGSLLLDCRSMTADEILVAWRSIPRDVIRRGLTPVIIADTPVPDTMLREGVTAEYLYPSPFSQSPDWDKFVQEKLDFLRRKYGVDRIMNGRTFAGGGKA